MRASNSERHLHKLYRGKSVFGEWLACHVSEKSSPSLLFFAHFRKNKTCQGTGSGVAHIETIPSTWQPTRLA